MIGARATNENPSGSRDRPGSGQSGQYDALEWRQADSHRQVSGFLPLFWSARFYIVGSIVGHPDQHVLDLPDPDPPDPLVTSTGPAPGPLCSKNSKKNLDLYCFVTFLWLSRSLKNDVNVLVSRIRIRRIHMFFGLLDSHPDPFVRGTDPRIRTRTRICIKMSRTDPRIRIHIRICIKMSRIPKTGRIRTRTTVYGPSSAFV